MIRTGLDLVAERGLSLPGRGRAGLLCNNATIDDRFRSAPVALQGAPGIQLDRLFSPQHGFAGEKQDNMVESRHGTHPRTGLPILSLYGEMREPSPDMLAGLDAVLIDVPDVGTRVYTFLITALYVIRAAARAGVPVWVLDRPNPIGGELVDGPVLDPRFESFVGLIPVPLQHGLTAGEYALLGKRLLRLEGELHVVAAQGWRRRMMQDETGLPWVMPSPNLPTLDTALVYPGGVLLEGTQLSEGRGTTRPFELCGAPWIDPHAVETQMFRWMEEDRSPREACLQGFVLREAAYEPTFHKFASQTVRGFQMHVTDRRLFRPVVAYTALLAAIRHTHPDLFTWRQPPYEYEEEKMPIDLLYGTDRVRETIDAGAAPIELVRLWESECARFREERQSCLLYPA